MVTLRRLTAMPDMPAWVRVVLAAGGLAMIVAAVFFAQPLVVTGWAWGRGLLVLVTGAIGVDLLLAGVNKRLPWLLDLASIGGT